MRDTRWMLERERERERLKMKIGLLLKVPRSIDRAFLIWSGSGIYRHLIYLNMD